VERAYEASYFEQRFRNRIYEVVIKAVEEAAASNKWKRKDLAARSGKKAPQITKWLSGPGNWTLDTVSNLLYAIDAELDFKVTKFSGKRKANEFHPLNNPIAAPLQTKVLAARSTAEEDARIDPAAQGVFRTSKQTTAKVAAAA
jgi:transcriptional regulator with XRE-family HTH domain